MVKCSQYFLIPATGLCINWSLYPELSSPRSGPLSPWTSQNWLITQVSVIKCHLQRKSLLIMQSQEVIPTIQPFHHPLNFFKVFSTSETTAQYLEVLKKQGPSKLPGTTQAFNTHLSERISWMRKDDLGNTPNSSAKHWQTVLQQSQRRGSTA